jgi:hypothetical protein
MCGGGGGSYEVAKPADPMPTAVTDVSGGNVSADRQANEQKRRRRGAQSTNVALDRGTILGTLSGNNGSTNNGGRNSLG